jgi:hypothetical protein
MALTQPFTKSFDSIVIARAKSSKSFRCGMLESAINEFLNGDYKVANLLLNDYMNVIDELQGCSDETNHYYAKFRSMLKLKNQISMDKLISLLRQMQKIERANPN